MMLNFSVKLQGVKSSDPIEKKNRQIIVNFLLQEVESSMNFVPRVLEGVTMVKISTNVICLDQIFVMGEFVSIQMALTDVNVPLVTNWIQGYLFQVYSNLSTRQS